MGARKQAKGSVGRRQRRQAPRREPRRQGEPATKRARPPPGTANAHRASAAPRPAPGDARGEAPCIKKAKNLPLPAGKGGMGADKQAKGRIGRRQRGQAPRLVPRRQGEPATKRASPPPGAANARRASAAPRPAPGDARGEAPCIKKLKISPFPGGEERSASAGWGDGGREAS